MQIEVIEIGPLLATSLLLKNTINRAISKVAVDQYARDMEAGNWKLTHQGILIGKDGVIIDGQHRLLAIVKSNTTQKMLVTIDESFETPLDAPIDTGNKRQAFFINGVSQRLSSVSQYAFMVHTGNGKASASELKPYINKIQPAYIKMLDGHEGGARDISKSQIVLAGCIHIMNGSDPEFIKNLYFNLYHSNFSAFTPIVESFYKQVVTERRFFTKSALFARAIKVFDESNSQITKLTILNEALAYESAKDLLAKALSHN